MPTISTANPRIKCRIANDCMNAISGSAERRPTRNLANNESGRARLRRAGREMVFRYKSSPDAVRPGAGNNRGFEPILILSYNFA
jgi:hypothetical protein